MRLVGYLLRIPTMPWCVDKHLIRASMKGMLPRKVLSRPKSPVARSMIETSLKHHGFNIPHKS
ncbi:MAG: hypothetical protein IPG76_22625 [Acidobacteria bacterium]|nr:hypothetical protein [Acidobacteriota bacterium]